MEKITYAEQDLYDRFAGQALISAISVIPFEKLPFIKKGAIAEVAYNFAESMILERRKRLPPFDHDVIAVRGNLS